MSFAKKLLILSSILLSVSLSLDARWSCCVNVSDGVGGGSDDTFCTGFESEAECNKSCSSRCFDIASNDSGNVLD